MSEAGMAAQRIRNVLERIRLKALRNAKEEHREDLADVIAEESAILEKQLEILSRLIEGGARRGMRQRSLNELIAGAARRGEAARGDAYLMADRMIDTTALKRFPEKEGAVDAEGRLQVKSVEFWNQFTDDERFAFCVQHGVYLLPTTELVNWLQFEITIGEGRPLHQLEHCIEIGSGNGVLSDALGIMGTDSMLQNRPEIAVHYAALGQALTKYGPRVFQFDAVTAVRRFKPSTVIGAWVTHLWTDELSSGSPHGIDEAEIIKRARYIFIGNDAGSTQHWARPILKLEHRRYTFPWLVSRGERGRDFIAVWERRP